MNNDTGIEDILKREGVYICTTSGVSMYPMLRDKRDTVVIRPVCGRLKKYDVPLYRRGDSYVLHRIIKVLPDSGYDIRGDNCIFTEKNISEDQIIGVLVSFWRGGKEVDLNSLFYRFYVRLWVFLHPLICIYKKLHAFLKALLRRVIKRK